MVTAGYLALLGLRAEYLVTVTGDSFLVAVFQSALLTAISAGLVLCGSAVLARTRSLRHSRARAATRRAVRAAADARQAHGEAHDKLQRHLDALHHMLLTGLSCMLPLRRASTTPNGPLRSSRPSAR